MEEKFNFELIEGMVWINAVVPEIRWKTPYLYRCKLQQRLIFHLTDYYEFVLNLNEESLAEDQIVTRRELMKVYLIFAINQ